MFTGLIETVGTLFSIRKGNESLNLEVIPDCPEFAVALGGSVSIDGACLTLTEISGNRLFFTAVSETVNRTTFRYRKNGDKVNLERAIKLGDRLDGHIVQGHVDCTGRIIHDVKKGDSILRTVEVPQEVYSTMPRKGSVALDGISLTISESNDCRITVSLISHTMNKTTMRDKMIGDYVNVECDIFARYIVHHLEHRPQQQKLAGDFDYSKARDGLLSLLENNGF